MKNKKSISETHPHLIEEWDFEKNGISPDEVTYGSNKKVRWICKDCGYSWMAGVSDRARKIRPSGCPPCGRERQKKSYIKTKVIKKGSLASTCSRLSDEWDKDKNGTLRPMDVTPGSEKKVHWICRKGDCRYSWQAVIKNRTRKIKPSGCPACYGRVVTDKNNFLVIFPDASKDWDKDKNILPPQEVTCKSSKIVWWKCSVCGYSWKAGVCDRTHKTRQRGCLVCLGRVATSTNNLKVLFPLLSEEWDEDKNGDLRPESVTYGADRKVWWVCKDCGHSWKAIVKNRTREVNPTGCPSCSKGNCSKISREWLDTLNIPKGYRERRFKGFGGKRGIRVDAYDPDTNTVYEFLGDYWHGNPEVGRFAPHKINKHSKKSFGKLYKETMERIDLLKENGYKVIYIWESDFRLKQGRYKNGNR